MKALFLILFSLSICSCDKDDLVAPPITQENTFSCKIDGELFVAQPHGGFLQLEGIIVVSSENKWLSILSNRQNHLYINLHEVNSPGLQKIVRSDGNTDFAGETNNTIILTADNGPGYISHNDTGFINILQWKNDGILIFEFDELILYDEENPSKTITLTNGKLNINMATLEY